MGILFGWGKKSKTSELENRRIEALSAITGERVSVEAMAQRPRSADDALNKELLEMVLKRLAEIDVKAREAAHVDDLDDLEDDAETQGEFSAYLCPVVDVLTEGQGVLNLLEWWGIPKTEIKKLRDLLESKLKNTDGNPAAARSALRALFEERNAWEAYSYDYEDAMEPWAKKLFWWTVGLLPAATLCFWFAARFSPLLIFGLLCAGAAGSCVSVLARMPGMDVSLSNELDAYDRRVVSRIGIGVIASLIGSGLLAWLPVSVQNHTLADALDACATGRATAISALTVEAFASILGFSERAVTFIEQRLFGDSNKVQKG
ncbi:MAG TPA: hypothetical protein VFA33_26530 [Bryobacteraceae bacterium]|nr:hypothetical protein [Bryobacteraceae bacterium]